MTDNPVEQRVLELLAELAAHVGTELGSWNALCECGWLGHLDELAAHQASRDSPQP